LVPFLKNSNGATDWSIASFSKNSSIYSNNNIGVTSIVDKMRESIGWDYGSVIS